MNALRWVAIASNVAFIAYGYLGELAPVLLLHALLLPVNIYRLAQLHGSHLRTDPPGAAGGWARLRATRIFRLPASGGTERSMQMTSTDGAVPVKQQESLTFLL